MAGKTKADRIPALFEGEYALHKAFVEHCDKCDCPMGCIHRQYDLPSAMLNPDCASILKCFARFVVQELKDWKEKGKQ